MQRWMKPVVKESGNERRLKSSGRVLVANGKW
jgi:hypothetical protein